MAVIIMQTACVGATRASISSFRLFCLGFLKDPQEFVMSPLFFRYLDIVLCHPEVFAKQHNNTLGWLFYVLQNDPLRIPGKEKEPDYSTAWIVFQSSSRYTYLTCRMHWVGSYYFGNETWKKIWGSASSWVGKLWSGVLLFSWKQSLHPARTFLVKL